MEPNLLAPDKTIEIIDLSKIEEEKQDEDVLITGSKSRKQQKK